MDRKAQRLDVTFKGPNTFLTREEIEEEPVYGNAAAFTVGKLEASSDYTEDIEVEPVYGNLSAFTVDKLEASSDHKYRSVFPPMIIWLIPIGILLLRLYFTSVISEKNNRMTLENQRLKTVINQLSQTNNELISDIEYLTRNFNNLTGQLGNLSQAKSVLEDENTNLKAEKVTFTEQIQELEAKKTNLTEQIQNMEAESIKSNISRAQWSVDAYCPKDNNARTCKPCEKAWLHNQSRCYAVNDHQSAAQRSWEGAREDCRGKGSDLVVVVDGREKKHISDESWVSSGSRGYWIGLRAENGKWKWVDGSDLANKSWMTAPPTDGRCVISVRSQGWKSVRCNEKQRWICEKEALSV